MSRLLSLRFTALLPLVAVLALACRPRLLPDAAPLERTMVDSAGHRFALDLPAGHYTYGVAEPEPGFDIAVTIRDADGRIVGGTIDQEGEDAAERFHLVSDQAQRFTVEVRGFSVESTDPLPYTLRLDAFRPATATDRQRTEGHAAFLTASQFGRCHDKRPWLDRADQLYSSFAVNPDDAFNHAILLLDIGICQAQSHGQPHAAVATLRRARDLAIQSRDRLGVEPWILNELGLAERRAGLLDQAEGHLLGAIDGFVEIGNDRDRLAAMLTLGTVYTDLGKWQDNLRLRRQVMAEAAELGFQEKMAFGIANQGWTLMRRGQPEEAEALFQQAAELRPDDRLLHAILVINRGFAALELGDLDRADQHFETCLRISDDAAHHVLARIGRVYVAIARRDPDRAGRLAREAVDATTALGRATWHARALDARARALALRDTPAALKAALADAETALSVIESTRPSERDDRAGYLDRHWNLVEMPVAAAVALHRHMPSAELLSRAFDNAERVRFRTLVEQLAEARPASADPLAERPSVATIRRALLDPQTALLQFHLGDRESFLFRLTDQRIDVFQLPPRSTIESRVASLRRAVTARAETGDRQAILEAERSYPAIAGELSNLLLAEALADLDVERLLIAADGDLHALPFAALPIPGTPPGEAWQPLLTRHEIVAVPSASFMTQLRQHLANRPPARRDLVIFADPVFGPPDDRLPPANEVDTTLPRLPHTATEAAAIARLASPSHRQYSGFDASKAEILGGALEGYRIVHIATHGEVGHTADQTALVLSLVDPSGRKIDGRLTVAGLSSLDLDAELVVLSACETAFGHELRGEGLLGLARGFMNAGAPRVVASLWKVDDRATRDLMVDLYRRLLRDGERPAAALRAAQQAMVDRREPIYHWAPFVLQGEWL